MKLVFKNIQRTPENNNHVKIGKQNYMVSPDGHLMPTRKDQPPPRPAIFQSLREAGAVGTICFSAVSNLRSNWTAKRPYGCGCPLLEPLKLTTIYAYARPVLPASAPNLGVLLEITSSDSSPGRAASPAAVEAAPFGRHSDRRHSTGWP